MNKTEWYKQNQQRCNKCGQIVGCDYRGRKHKCGCKDNTLDRENRQCNAVHQGQHIQ